MLRISPFNDYSGQYSATAYKVYFKGNEKEAIVPEYHTSYVIDDKTIFFYDGECFFAYLQILRHRLFPQ